MYYIRDISLFSIILGLLVIFSVKISGSISTNNRLFLLKIFKPSLRITLFSLAILIPIFALLLIFILYFLESYVFQMVHIQILALIGIGALVGSSKIIKSCFSFVKEAETEILAKSFSKEDSNIFIDIIKEISSNCKSRIPDNILIGLSPTFFVTEGTVKYTAELKTKGTSLYISLPLCRILTIDELKSVLYHEFAHFTGEDTVFSQKFYPIYRGTLDSLNIMSEQIGSGASGFSYYPAIYILNYFYESFALAESKISRERELRADSNASSQMGNKTIGTALLKIHAFAEGWGKVHTKIYEAAKKKQYIENASLEFAKFLTIPENKNNLISDIEKHSLFHPTDSHPPLSERLENLKLKMEDIMENSLELEFAESAVTIIPNYELIEKDLTTVENQRLKEFIEIYDTEEENSG